MSCSLQPSSGMARPQCHGALACLSLTLLTLLARATTATSSYSSLCGTPAPASDLPASHRHRSTDTTPSTHLPDISTGHFSGGEDLHFAPDESNIPRSFFFYYMRTPLATEDPAVQHVYAKLRLMGAHDGLHAGRHSVSFDLEGYYSTASSSSSPESSELCMVGTGRYAREDGFVGSVVLSDVVLRLHVPLPANLSRPFVTGRLEGTGFGAVNLVAYADTDYEFGAAASCPAPAPSSSAPARAPRQVRRARPSCHRLQALLRGTYDLEYGPGDHNATRSWSPLRLPHQRMYFNQMRCASDGKVRAYMVFDGNISSSARWSNYTFRDGFLVRDEALVAEGSWNASLSQLCLRACRVVRSGPSRADLAVVECGVGVSVRFPSVWSIRDRSVAAGMLWNTSSRGDAASNTSGVISVSRSASYTDDLSYIKYNYTRVEEAKKLYDSMPALSEGRRMQGPFPGNDSYRDFAFFFHDEEHRFHGYASPVAIGSAVVQGDRLTSYKAFYGNWTAETKSHWLLNVSYDVQFFVGYLNSTADTSISQQWLSRQQRISAEGVYDTEAGSLCLVGCQALGNNGSSDCEVLVTAQFAPVGAVARERVSGTVSSLRQQGDPLRFEALGFAAEGMYAVQVEESVSRMDVEGVLVVASATLSCVFTGLQILHVKRHPEALRATSVTMLVVLAVGYAVPLVLNLEATVFKDDTEDGSRRSSSKRFVRLTSGGMLELNELMLRVSSLLAFVLQLRLLQLAMSSRRCPASAEAAGEGVNKQAEPEEHSSAPSSDAERSTLWTCLSLYSLGAILVWILHLSDAHAVGVDGPWTGAWGRAVADDLAAYAGLVLDGFLLPQVVWNAFAGVRVQAISPLFYAGGAAVRAAPHAYDVYRRRSYVEAPLSYVYASPHDDMFGVAWDVAVPCGIALLAVLVFLQQRLGGAFLCGGVRGRRPGGYETVSTLSS